MCDQSIKGFEREIKSEYVSKIARINELLEELTGETSVQYRLIDLSACAASSSALKCQVVDSGNVVRVISLEAVDRRIKSLTNQLRLKGMVGGGCGDKENAAVSTTGRSVVNSNRPSTTQQELNTVLFETIQLITKLKAQYSLLK